MNLTNFKYMEDRAKFRRRADLLMKWMSEEQKDTWSHQMAVLTSSDRHLLTGGKWSRGPTVLTK
jgi:predicted ABC-type exoprotein transport system permease subunit